MAKTQGLKMTELNLEYLQRKWINWIQINTYHMCTGKLINFYLNGENATALMNRCLDPTQGMDTVNQVYNNYKLDWQCPCRHQKTIIIIVFWWFFNAFTLECHMALTCGFKIFAKVPYDNLRSEPILTSKRMRK